jgi:Bacterial Ig-like domain
LPPVPDTTVSADDISAVIAFKGQIGVMWSNQVSAAFRFATHQDGAPDSQWGPLETPLSGPDLADDHINLKNIEADADGRLYAAVKTSQGDNGEPSSSPLDVLLVRSATGGWANYTFSTVAEDETRPIVLLDQTNHTVYYFATAPTTPGGTVYYKSTPMNNIAFGPGKGTPFVTWPGAIINNATSTKQPVTSATGIVVLASDSTTGTYYHAEMPLPGAAAPAVTLVQPPDGSFGNDTTPTLSGAAGQQPGDAETVTARIFAGTAPSGSPLETLTADGTSGAWSVDASALAEGIYTAQAYQSNADGLVGTSAAHTFTVDTTTPDTSIDSAPPDPSTSSSVSFSFSATEPGSTFTCRLDGGSWGVCSSPTQLTGLSNARHTFDVRATDRAGNTDATPATDSFTVDAPITTSFTPVADTYSRQDKPNSNFGTQDSMRAATATSTTKRGYLRFNVSGLTGAVIRVTLQLWTKKTLTVNGLDLRGVGDNTWGEKTLTWNNAPAVGAAVAKGGVSAPSNTWITLDATSLVTGNGTVSMGLTTSSSTEASVAAREDALHAPRLVVETH